MLVQKWVSRCGSGGVLSFSHYLLLALPDLFGQCYLMHILLDDQQS